MTYRWMAIVATVVFVLFARHDARAQGASTASISGVVVDSAGGVVPGADVVIRNIGTGESFTTVTGGPGVFSVPSLITGTYRVTVSLQGFKTVVLNNVIVNAGVPANVRATLEVGGIAEQVVVVSNSALVQTQSPSVSTTLDTRQVANLPLSTRSSFEFLQFLPGVQTAETVRNSIVSGLPQSTINITIDGVSLQDNTNKTTDGFFAMIGPRIDAVEEITFTTGAQGAEGLGMGATQIRFVTRSGTNEFHGSAFHNHRRDELNANNWFNTRDGLAKPELLRNEPGFNIGGPVMLPGFNGRNRAFFFVNYEELHQPSSLRRNRTILNSQAQQGMFRYNTTQGVREVNLFQLAAANGQTSTPDPIIAGLLADIRTASASGGNVRDLTDPLFQEYSWLVPVRAENRFPTVRVDYQLNNDHRVTYSMNYQYAGGGPDTTNNREPFFPGFPVFVNQGSTRRAASAWLRSVLGKNVVNEARFGYSGAPIDFGFIDFRKEMWSGTLANQGGFHLNLNNALSPLTNAGASATPSGRDAYSRSFENTVHWQKGAHSFNFGGAFSQFDLWMDNQQLVPELRFGVVTGVDPADAMFNAANFQGASTANLTAARNLYAVLTGRVSEVRGIARLNEATGNYEYNGLGTQRASQRELGFWAQDSWRMRPNVSVSYGIRYELQFPFVAMNNSYSIGDYDDIFGVSGSGNIFKPGTLTGQYPEFRQLSEGERPYPMDWNNVAPSIGAVWTPSATSGLLRRLTGETGDMSIRGGFSRAYTRLGLGTFTGAVSANPGVSLNVFRQNALGNLGTLPLLLRDASRLGPAAFPDAPSFPFRDVQTGDITVFSPRLEVPYADTWQAGVTRALGSTMSVEARYFGSRSKGSWRTNNYNELNMVENGFLDEFKLAMTNLQTNIAAGRGGTFAYFGPGTGTSPLPIFLAYFNGISRERASDASLYTSANFRSTTFLNPLARFNPNPYSAVDNLDADATSRQRALAAGLPANFIVANPDLLGGANVVENTSNTDYHSMALEFRRRSSSGLGFSTSYVLGHATESQFLSLRIPTLTVRNGGTEGDVTHAFKLNWVYPLPFGSGGRFGRDAGAVLDRVIGGWQLAGNARIQSGRLVDFGNVRLVGMTRDELDAMFKVRIDAERRVWMLPQSVIDESVKAFNASATSATGWGPQGAPSGQYIAPADSFDCIETIRGQGLCGQRTVVLTGPMFKVFDVSLVKRVPLKGRFTAEFRADVLNAFNNVNFAPVSGMTITNNRASGSDPDDYDVTGLVGSDQGRVVQLVARVRW